MTETVELTSENIITQADEGQDKIPGYFLVSLSGLRRVIQEASDHAAVVYIAMAAGVDHRNKKFERGCTHGAMAIQLRTGLTRDNVIPKATDELLKIGAIVPAIDPADPTPAKNRPHNAVKYLVDPTRTDDLVAIDQRFLNPLHARRKPGDRKKASIEESDLKRIVMSSEMSRQSMPYTDALLLLVALLSRLDYSAYGAVDPCAASTRFVPTQPNEPFDDASAEIHVPGHPNLRLILAKEGGFPLIQKRFADQLFDGLAADELGAGMEPLSRAQTALKLLLDLGMVGSVHIVWNRDPLSQPTTPTRVSARPVATLYVTAGDDFRGVTPFLQYAIDAAIKRVDAISGRELYPRDEHGKVQPVFKKTGIYRYFVHQRQLGSAVALTQLRVKWWAHSDSHLAGLEADRIRHNSNIEALLQMSVEGG